MTYTEQSLIWALLGFTTGFAVGYGWRLLHRPHRPDEEDEHVRTPIIVTQRGLGAVLLLLAVAMIVQNYVYQRDRTDIVECQARYNLAMSAAIGERARVAAEDRANLVLLVQRVVHADKEGESTEALRDFLARQEQIDEDRPQLPPIPAGRCGL